MPPRMWWHRGLSLRWLSWWCPALPYPGGCSTIGAGGLSFRVRYGAGRGSPAMTTRTGLVGAPTGYCAPRVWGVVSRWCACPVFCSRAPRPLVHRCGADQRVWWGLVVDRIVDAHPPRWGVVRGTLRVPDACSFACVCVLCRPVSTGQLHGSPRFHARPINPVVYRGPTTPPQGGGRAEAWSRGWFPA